MFGLGANPAGYNAATTAGNTAAGYGSSAANVSSTLLPFLTRELNNPQGFTQQQQGAMLGATEAGAGGATAGLTTEANLASARDRNSGGFSGALDDAARQGDKALAGGSERIAADNANLEQQQQQDAARGLAGEQGLDTNAQLNAMGLVPEDLNAQSNLNKTSGMSNWAAQLSQLANTVGGIGSAFFPGGQAGKIFGGLSKV